MGRLWKLKDKSTIRSHPQLVGDDTFEPSRIRSVAVSSGEQVRGELVPTKHLLGLTEVGLTQAAACLAMMLLSNLSTGESVDVLKRASSEATLISTMAGSSAKLGQCPEEVMVYL